MDNDDKYIKKMIKIVGILIFIFFLVVGSTVVLYGCTISVTTVHTQGTASDVVDEQQAADPTVSPNVSIPAL